MTLSAWSPRQVVGRCLPPRARVHEGRCVGLAHKLEAYKLQDRGRDTVEANLDLGLPVDNARLAVGGLLPALAQLGLDQSVRIWATRRSTWPLAL
jgi:hypothetical protein